MLAPNGTKKQYTDVNEAARDAAQFSQNQDKTALPGQLGEYTSDKEWQAAIANAHQSGNKEKFIKLKQLYNAWKRKMNPENQLVSVDKMDKKAEKKRKYIKQAEMYLIDQIVPMLKHDARGLEDNFTALGEAVSPDTYTAIMNQARKNIKAMLLQHGKR